MRKLRVFGNARLPLLLALACLGVAGCAHSAYCPADLDALAPHVAQIPDDGEAATVDVTPTSLDDLVDLATSRHPELRSARARVEAAYGAMIQAGLYPNPVVGPQFKAIAHRDNNLGEIGFGVAQTIVRRDKLALAQAAAAHGVSAADWQALTRWFAVLTRVRLAYIELLAARRERDTVLDMERVARDIFQAAEKLEQRGAGNRPDVLRAKVELEQQALKKAVADHKLEAARRTLAAAVGVAEVDVNGLRGDLDKEPRRYAWDTLLEWMVNSSAEIQEARVLIAQREQLVFKAEADVRPDIDVSALPYYSAPNRQMTGEIIITAAVPIFNRNEGNIRSARAELARARADEQDLVLKLRERLAAAYQRFQSAQAQVDAYRKRILPEARESLRLVEVGYRSGDAKYNYTVLFQAQQTLFGAQLGHVQALADLQRAAAELAGIAQLDEFP
jgi:cobalt-zinc-cadmium efflux system outer membrane protein